jgi:hypothetical protein
VASRTGAATQPEPGAARDAPSDGGGTAAGRASARSGRGGHDAADLDRHTDLDAGGDLDTDDVDRDDWSGK